MLNKLQYFSNMYILDHEQNAKLDAIYQTHLMYGIPLMDSPSLVSQNNHRLKKPISLHIMNFNNIIINCVDYICNYFTESWNTYLKHYIYYLLICNVCIIFLLLFRKFHSKKMWTDISN